MVPSDRQADLPQVSRPSGGLLVSQRGRVRRGPRRAHRGVIDARARGRRLRAERVRQARGLGRSGADEGAELLSKNV